VTVPTITMSKASVHRKNGFSLLTFASTTRFRSTRSLYVGSFTAKNFFLGKKTARSVMAMWKAAGSLGTTKERSAIQSFAFFKANVKRHRTLRGLDEMIVNSLIASNCSEFKCLVSRAVSRGRRNTSSKSTRRGSTAKSRWRALIQTEHHPG
jgi:hypothetical protein